MSQQEKPVEGSAEEIPSVNERYVREDRFMKERQEARQERLLELETKMNRITQIGNIVSLAAVGIGMFAISKRLDGIDALMTGLRQSGVQISVTTARHLAENAEEIAGTAG